MSTLRVVNIVSSVGRVSALLDFERQEGSFGGVRLLEVSALASGKGLDIF